MRFTNNQHTDFICIPSMLKSKQSAVTIHNNIQSLTLSYLDKSLKQQNGFDSYWKEIANQTNTTNEPFTISDSSKTSTAFSSLILLKQTNEPLPCVNIGVLNREIGIQFQYFSQQVKCKIGFQTQLLQHK